MISKSEAEDFFKRYEKTTNGHDFSKVRDLLNDDIVYWFLDGSYTDIDELEKAFVSTWDKVKDEKYTIHDVEWLALDENSATCVYTFRWEGIVNGEKKQGEGRGTNVIIKKDGKLYIAHEHLSKF